MVTPSFCCPLEPNVNWSHWELLCISPSLHLVPPSCPLRPSALEAETLACSKPESAPSRTRVHSQHPWFLLGNPSAPEFPVGTCYRLNRYRLNSAQMKLERFRSFVVNSPNTGKKVIVN